MASNGYFKRPKGQGDKLKLTEELQEKICNIIAQGNYIETAAALSDVSRKTLYEWLKKGNREKSGIYRDFLNTVEKAMAIAEYKDVSTIGKAAEENWTAAAWRLERRNPKQWGRKDSNDLNISGSIENKVIFWGEPK